MEQKANISIDLWVTNAPIGFDLGHDIDLEFSKSNKKFISAKNGPIVTKRKANISIEPRPQTRPTDLTLAMTLTLNFQGQKWNFAVSQQKRGLIAMNWKANISIEIYASNVTIGFDFYMTLTLDFWGQILKQLSQGPIGLKQKRCLAAVILNW